MNNGIGRIIPPALRKIGVPNKASEIIPEAVSLGRDLNDN